MASLASIDWDISRGTLSTLTRALGQQIRIPQSRSVREPVPINERLLQCIWYDGHFHEDGLTLADGRVIEIRSPGRWNGEAGPDFLQAEITIDGERIKGDVELHLRASDWRSHGHAGDPAYRGVILHVVLDIDDGLTCDPTPTGGNIPRLAMRPVLHGDMESLGEIISTEDFPYSSPSMVGRCSRVMSRLDHDPQVTAFFSAAAVRRLKGKVERLRSQLGDSDFDQVFHQALMTSLGHRGSKTLFFLLAKRVPIAELRSLTRPWTGRERVLAAEALLLHVANLVRPSPENSPQWDDETMKHVDALNRVWGELGGMFSDRMIPRTAQWHRGMRPASFPSRRIAGVSHLGVGESTSEAGLFAALMRHCEDFAEDAGTEKAIRGHIKSLIEILAVDEPNDFWARRHTLGGKRLDRPQRLIGEAQARSVIFNALLPLTTIWARQEKRKRVLKWAHAAIEHFPALAENTVTRFMKYRLFGTPDAPKSLFKTEMRHQALFHVFTACCDHSTTSCERCAFFARLPG